MFTLKVYRGERIVQELDLDGPEVKIGRSPDNSVVLADDGKGVSRVHAIIRLEDGNYVLYDGNSRNGTFVDGKPIKRTPIEPGQDFVIGPYRLVFGSSEYSGSMPTVVATRPEPLPTAPPKEATAKGAGREATARGGPTAQTKSGEGSTKSRPATTGKTATGVDSAQKEGLPIAYVAVATLAAIIVVGVFIWQLLPVGPVVETVDVSTTTTTTSIPDVTTTIPLTTIDPHAEQVAQASLAMEAADAAFAAKRFAVAAREFNRVLKEYISPILAVDPQYAPALELEALAKARATEADLEAGKLAKAAETTKKPRGPNDVLSRPGESEEDYWRRNAEAQSDYALGTRLFNQGEYLDALKVFSDLAGREPGWRDVSTYARNTEDAVNKERQQALNEALRIEGEGHKLMVGRDLPAAAATLMSARKAFDRAAALQVPGIEKHLAENLVRRRHVAEESIKLARTHANNKNWAEARKWYQLVIDLLPPGEPLRKSGESELSRVP